MVADFEYEFWGFGFKLFGTEPDVVVVFCASFCLGGMISLDFGVQWAPTGSEPGTEQT